MTADVVTQLIDACGSARHLAEPPCAAGSATSCLAARITKDAGREDATTIAAFEEGVLAGLAVLRFPQWDREHFGYVVGRVEHLQGSDERVLGRVVTEAVHEFAARDARMCSARVPSDALAVVRSLEDGGFRYVELMLTPWRDLSGWEHRGFGVTRPAQPDDLPQMCAVARRAFRTDRFHRDRRFSREAADGVYDRWVRTWQVEQSHARCSRVLVLDGAVAGFFLLELLDPAGDGATAVAKVILNAVDPSRAGQGHGFRMYCDALDAASHDARYCSADVAAANPAVLNLYARLGFQLTSGGDVTMHWWRQD